MRTLLQNRSLVAAAAVLSAACQAAPPTYEVELCEDTVRAESPFLATHVAGMLSRNRDEVLRLVPGSAEEPVEVWLQEELKLYRFSSGSFEHADGFWAEEPGRIHLRTEARHLERTLVHELVHAYLGDEWSVLPGTIEEGVCDWVSATVCPHSRAQLRAGRLSAACFGLGALEIEVELRSAASRGAEEVIGSYASILLEGGIQPPVAPEEVFELRAGRSSSKLPAPRKKALYGLAFFIVDRIAAQGEGLQPLYELCLRAHDEGLAEIPSEWLLEAAGLTSLESSAWKPGLAEAFSGAELAELVAMYPEFLGSAIDRLPVPTMAQGGAEELRFAMRVNPR